MKTSKLPHSDLETLIPLLISVWRRYKKLSGPPDRLQTREFRNVVEAVGKIKQGLEEGDVLVGEDYFKDPDLLGAYLLYYWIVHYQQGLTLINEVPHPIGRVLDLASGPGAFALAALRHGAREVVAVDRNEAALKLSSELCGRYGYPLACRRHSLRAFPLPLEGKFDLIILGHCLQELFPEKEKDWRQRQLEWVQNLIPFLSPNGKILFVESSLKHANHRLLALRDQLVELGIPVQAPCVWKGACVALQAKSVCYAQREFEKPFLVKEIQRAAQINLGSLKMSYLIIRHPEAGWPSAPQSPLYRVISPPIEAHSGKRFHLCGTDGKKDLGTRLREGSKEAKAFDYLKRGELISIDEALVNGDHYDIIPGTEVKVEAALGKPLPFD